VKSYKIIYTDFALGQMEPLPVKLLRNIRTTTELVAQNPGMFELATDYYEEPYRRFHVDRYRIVYRVDDENQAIYISWVAPAAVPLPPESDLEASERT